MGGLKKVKHNQKVWYYVEPWNGLFYKSNKYELVSEKTFKNDTTLSFQDFYTQHCKNEVKNNISLNDYLLENLDLPDNSHDYVTRLVNRLAMNTKHLSNVKVLEKLVEKKYANLAYDKYQINANKKAIKIVVDFVVTSTAESIIISLPRYKILFYLNKIKEIDTMCNYVAL